jgi:hypothetical protein
MFFIRNIKLKSGEYIYCSIIPGKENRQEVDLKSFAHAAAEVTNMEDCGGDQLCYRGAVLHCIHKQRVKTISPQPCAFAP